MDGLRDVYGRVLPFIRAMPLIAALPVLAQLLQHGVELTGGVYGPGPLPYAGPTILDVSLGSLKVVALLFAALVAARTWRFSGNRRRALAFDARFALGVGLMILTQLLIVVVLVLLQTLVAWLLGPEAETLRIVAVALLIVSLAVAVLLAPWYVALVADDRTMTAGVSIRASRHHMLSLLGLYIGAYLPPLALHYALTYFATGARPIAAWGLLTADSLLVGLFAVLVGSAYYSLYRAALDRSGRGPVS
jgi:hypothetical protein